MKLIEPNFHFFQFNSIQSIIFILDHYKRLVENLKINTAQNDQINIMLSITE
jgi:hypothetical protein